MAGNRLRNELFACESPAMRRAIAVADSAAACQAGAFVHGEAGTGKRRLAEAIHANAHGTGMVLMAMDCTAPEETILRAVEAVVGFDHPVRCGRCPLLIERLDRLAPDICEWLVTQLWPNAFTPYVESMSWIITSRRSRERLAARHPAFDELLARVAAMDILVPPLRKRGPDVPRLARAFLEQQCEEEATSPLALSVDAIDALRAYDWPGNVTELREVIGWAVLAAVGRNAARITAADLPSEVGEAFVVEDEGGEEPFPVRTQPTTNTLEQEETARILAAHKAHGGRRKDMAEELGVSETTLRRRLKELGMLRRYRPVSASRRRREHDSSRARG